MQLVIANTCEPFLPLLKRYVTAETEFRLKVTHEHSLADRATFWCGDNKILITPKESHTCALALRKGVFHNIKNLWPRTASPSLCKDISRDKEILAEIVSLCGDKPVDLRAYAVTDQLVKLAFCLREQGVNLRTPEFSIEQGQAVGRFFDTKAGFRQLMSNWFGGDPQVRIPFGRIAETRQKTVSEAFKFLDAGKACVVKPDCGESGIGLIWLHPDRMPSRQTLSEMIASDDSFGDDPIVVEEHISAPDQPGSPFNSSPSVEVEVKAAGPKVTYICDQIISPQGEFQGIKMGLHVVEPLLARSLAEIGLKVGARLHSSGYRGHFDIDFAIDKSGLPFALEANTRRTGGTHAHDLASHIIGPNYADVNIVSSNDSLCTQTDLADVETYVLNQVGDDGLALPSILSALDHGSIGYVAIAQSTEFVTKVEERLGRRPTE